MDLELAHTVPLLLLNGYKNQLQAGRPLFCYRHTLRSPSRRAPDFRVDYVVEIPVHLKVESSFFVELDHSDVAIAVIQRNMSLPGDLSIQPNYFPADHTLFPWSSNA